MNTKKALRAAAAHLVCCCMCAALVGTVNVLAAPAWNEVDPHPGDPGVGDANTNVGSLLPFMGKLFAGGTFRTAEGDSANHIAQWDPVEKRWDPVPFGASPGGVNGNVTSMAVLFGGAEGCTGDCLYIGGSFTVAHGLSDSAHNVVALAGNGNSFVTVGTGFNGLVRDLATLADGSGDKLYAAGSFTKNGTETTDLKGVARLTAIGEWEQVGDGIAGQVFVVTAVDEVVYAGGSFAGGSIARLVDGQWTPVLGGVSGGVVTSIVSLEPRILAVAGTFTHVADQQVNSIALLKLDGDGNPTQWCGLGDAPLGTNGGVAKMLVFDDNTGRGNALYVGGNFNQAGGAETRLIARWGKLEPESACNEWESLQGGLDGANGAIVLALTEFQDDLLVGGRLDLANTNADSSTFVQNVAQWMREPGGKPVREDGENEMVVSSVGDCETCFEPTAVEDPRALAPLGPHLEPAVPNPFSPNARLRFSLVEAGDVLLTVHDAEGRQVATLLDTWQIAGDHTATWDGHDSSGQDVVSGVYFVHLRAPGGESSQKILLAR